MKDTKIFKDKNGETWVKVEVPTKNDKKEQIKTKIKAFSIPAVFWFNFVINFFTLLFLLQNYQMGMKAIVFSALTILILFIVFICVWEKL